MIGPACDLFRLMLGFGPNLVQLHLNPVFGTSHVTYMHCLGSWKRIEKKSEVKVTFSFFWD